MTIDSFDTNFKSNSSSIENVEGLLGIELGMCGQLLGIQLGMCAQLLGIELGMCAQLLGGIEHVGAAAGH